MKLHEAIAEVLRSHGGGWMDRDEIAREIAERDLFRRPSDGRHPPSDQIRLRVRSPSYADLFECADPGCDRVRLRSSRDSGTHGTDRRSRMEPPGTPSPVSRAAPRSSLRLPTERRRQQYRPRSIVVLFVGESPPAGGTFFYDGNSILFFEIRKTFESSASLRNRRGSFLETFRDLGCYLDDLCLEPVNHLAEPQRAMKRLESEPALAARIGEYQPRIVVAIGKTTAAPHVQRALGAAALREVRFKTLPFPGRPMHKQMFAQQLAVILENELGGGARK